MAQEKIIRLINRSICMKKILDSDLFISDKITRNMIFVEKEHIFRRPIPDEVLNAPNILIRLNINHQIPISYNTQYNVHFRPGVLGLKGDNNLLMQNLYPLLLRIEIYICY